MTQEASRQPGEEDLPEGTMPAPRKSLGNLPKGDLFYLSTRGERLHLKVYVPEDPASIKAVLLFQHGYGGHSSSPPKQAFGQHLCDRGIAVIQPDLLGHGYSEVSCYSVFSCSLFYISSQCSSCDIFPYC
jgi:pimeloyl-ACP methyl ester carboxylesterase